MVYSKLKTVEVCSEQHVIRNTFLFCIYSLHELVLLSVSIMETI